MAGAASAVSHGAVVAVRESRGQVLTLHVVPNLAIFLSCVAMAVALPAVRMRYRRELQFGLFDIAFGGFLILTGASRLIGAVAPWMYLHWLSDLTRISIALAGIATAITFPRFLAKLAEMLQQARSSRMNEQRFLTASNNSHEAFYILQSERNEDNDIVDFRFVFVNDNGADLVSKRSDELVGQLLCEIMPINRTHGFFETYKQVVETGEPVLSEFAINAEGLKASWLRHHVVKFEDGIAISTSNVSDRKEAELKLVRSLESTRSLIESSPVAIIAVGLDGLITEMNTAAERLVGYRREELAGKSSMRVLHLPGEIEDRARALSHELGERIDGDAVFTARPMRGLVEEAEWTYVRKNGSHVLVQLTFSAMRDTQQRVTGWLGVAVDITERKRMEEYASYVAQHDSLTGLPTRTLLHDRLEKAMQRAQRNSTKIGLMMVDLDNFKRVNDLMGHSIGDELLVAVAKRLEKFVRKSDTVARMGGDEFIVLLDDLKTVEDGEKLAEKLVTVLSKPIVLNGEENSMSASIGLCFYPDGGHDTGTLLKNADAAMYFAKSQGRNMFQVFSMDMATATAKRRTIENALHHALAHGEFELMYQPQIAFETGLMTGLEGLLRWDSKTLGRVMPNDFIPVAEDTGLIVPIGEWVLRTACHQAVELQRQMGREFVMAVNLSPRQFQQEALPQIVEEVLAQSGLRPENLELEITENILVSDSDKALRVLDRVRALGVRIAIDDFGTGFSSMSYILKFNVHRLKIDQSFIRNMIEDRNSEAITKAIIALAQGLKINVVAEGVETSAIADLLRQDGCDEAQGYFYSRPLAFWDVEEKIAEIEAMNLAVGDSFIVNGWLPELVEGGVAGL